MRSMDEVTITKKLSKQGTQTVLIIPSFLADELKPHMIVEAKIKILERGVQ